MTSTVGGHGPRAPALARRGEDPAYLEEQLITYLGNKRALLPGIAKLVATVRRRLAGRQLRAADLFSGSGVVARLLKRHCSELLANDLEAYSRVTNECYLANRSSLDWSAIGDAIEQTKARLAADWRPGFLSELYAPEDDTRIGGEERAFYTRRNAIYLDSARRAIAELPADLQSYLLAPLLAKASVHSNTAGVFKGFYKNADGRGQFGGAGRDALVRILGHIELVAPVLSRFECDCRVRQEDANALVARLPELDLAYLDPPYNQHPYGSNYFMLNLLVDYRRPVEISRVSGIPADWNRSRYNQRRQAELVLFELIERVPARFVLVSYNSEGFIGRDRFVERLAGLGKVKRTDITYNTFRGSRNLLARPLHVTESLYLLEK